MQIPEMVEIIAEEIVKELDAVFNAQLKQTVSNDPSGYHLRRARKLALSLTENGRRSAPEECVKHG